MIGRRIQQEAYVVVFSALVGGMGYVGIRFSDGVPTLPDLVQGELAARSRGTPRPSTPTRSIVIPKAPNGWLEALERYPSLALARRAGMIFDPPRSLAR